MVLHDPQLVESLDVELWIQGTLDIHLGFRLRGGGSMPITPELFKGQP